MQNAMVQMPARRSVKETSSPTRSKQGTTETAELADPFLQIIMNMVANVQESETQNAQTQALSVGGLNPNLEMQMPLALMDNQLLQNLQNAGTSKELESLLPQLKQLTNADTGSINIVGMVPNEENLNVQNPQLLQVKENQSVQGETAPKPSEAKVISEQNAQTDIKGIFQEEKSAVAQDREAGIALKERDFASSVSKVKEMLSSSEAGDKDSGKEIDVDKLQSEVLQGKTISSFELKMKTTTQTAEPKCAEQILEGLKQNLSLGKKEFTIKLRPESLGEITVKLVEEDGKTTLSITAASSQTAKLINSDLAGLKEAMAPMNVHVNEAVSQSNASQQSGMQQFDLSGQQFAGQQFAGQQNFVRYADAPYSADDAFIAEAPDDYKSGATHVPKTDRLDAYI